MIYIKPEVYGSSDLTSRGSQIRPPQDLACYMTAKRLKPYIFLGPALVLCWNYNMLYTKWALALDVYARRFLQCFQLACAAVPWCTVSVKISMKAPPVHLPTSSPPFLPPPLSCPQGGSNYNSFWRQKMHNATLYNSTVCAHKKTLLISSNFNPNVAYL